MKLYYSIVAVLAGFAVGSFVNVLIHRLPRDISIVHPWSFCPKCGHRIAWFQNIPLVSFLFLRGRCAQCGSPISMRYPLVEGLGGILAALCVLHFGFTIDAAFCYTFMMALLAVMFIDWEFRIIPDRISLPFILLGLLWSIISERLTLRASILGMVVGGGSLLVVALVYKLVRGKEGMGGGDVKLMAMIGAALGIRLVLPVILIASLAGTIYGMVLLRKGEGAKTAIAFGSFLAPAAGICFFLGNRILALYSGAL